MRCVRSSYFVRGSARAHIYAGVPKGGLYVPTGLGDDRYIYDFYYHMFHAVPGAVRIDPFSIPAGAKLRDSSATNLSSFMLMSERYGMSKGQVSVNASIVRVHDVAPDIYEQSAS